MSLSEPSIHGGMLDPLHIPFRYGQELRVFSKEISPIAGWERANSNRHVDSEPRWLIGGNIAGCWDCTRSLSVEAGR